MPASQDAKEISNAIKENTKELRKLREAVEKSNRAVNNFVQNFPKEPLDLEAPEHDYTK